MKRLKRGMIFDVFISLMIVFLAIIGALKFTMSSYYRKVAETMTELIEENDGEIPTAEEYDRIHPESIGRIVDIDDETAYRTRYFIVYLDENGEITDTKTDHIAGVEESEEDALVEAAMSGKHMTGYKHKYFYRVTVKDDTTDIVFLDCTEYRTGQNLILTLTAFIELIFTIIVTIVFALLSSRILQPFEENNKRQKRFITDASHELKTPLAIISANADVLKFKDGENVWLNNITDQTKRMSEMISELLALTKADEVGTDFVKESIDLTAVTDEIWEEFKGPAEEKHVTMKKDMPDHLMMRGSSDMLKRLFSVLIENASKYVSEGGVIDLKAAANARNITISLYNTADLAEDFDCRHLFERFYRPDSSRTSGTGGHGIGLSIAQRITENHRGKITAEKAEGGICFRVVLPVNLK